MSNKKGTAPIDKAVPTITKPKKTDVQKVSCTRTTTQAMQQSASWATATDVQGAVKAWNKNADDLEANTKTIAAIKEQLKAAEAKQRTIRRSWRASTQQVLSTVNVFCEGSADLVKGLGVEVRSRTAAGALDAPADLTLATGKEAGEVGFHWLKGKATHGFVVQHATDPNNAATYSAMVPCTKTRYTLDGQPSKSTVYGRVAAVDPTSPSGLGPWSVWAAGTAR
jgi:hypothetical protein